MTDATIPQTPSDQKMVPEKDLLAIDVLAYVAGLFDGEGSVFLTVRKSGLQFLRATIGNTNVDCLGFTQEYLGGNLAVGHARMGHLVCYRLEWCGSNAKRVMELLLPYLIVKQDIAKLAIAFQDIIESHRGSTVKISGAEMAKRDAIAQAMKILNVRC